MPNNRKKPKARTAKNAIKTYCIGLHETKDRKEYISLESLKLIDSFEYIYADPPHQDFESNNYMFPRELGCTLSHLKAMIYGSRCRKDILVIEDDIIINDDASNILKQSINELPKNWGVLYLGGRPKSQTYYFSKNLIKVDEFASTQSYLVNKKYIKSYIDFTLDNISLPFPNACSDNILNNFFKQKSYCIYPSIVKPKPGFSVLRFSDRDYSAHDAKFWKEFSPKNT